MIQHKSGTFDGFTKKYGIDRLMYFETYTGPKIAAHRERQIKKYRREKKIALFSESNPEWKDLTPELFQSIGISRYARDFRKELFLNPIRKFLNHRIGEHFFGNPLDFSLGGVFVQAAIQVQFKKLALAHCVHAFIAHLLERAVNGLALRIKDGGLEHDCDVCLHGDHNIIAACKACA